MDFGLFLLLLVIVAMFACGFVLRYLDGPELWASRWAGIHRIEIPKRKRENMGIISSFVFLILSIIVAEILGVFPHNLNAFWFGGADTAVWYIIFYSVTKEKKEQKWDSML